MTPLTRAFVSGMDVVKGGAMASKIVFHMNPHVDVTRLQVEYDIHGQLSDLLPHLHYRSVELVEFVKDTPD